MIHSHLHIVSLNHGALRHRANNLPEIASLCANIHWPHGLALHLQIKGVLAIVVVRTPWMLFSPVVQQHDILVGDLLDGVLDALSVVGLLLPCIAVFYMQHLPLCVAAVDRSLGHVQVS